ncbi:MAG: AMP-binding protein [Actinomycetota bacterium]
MPGPFTSHVDTFARDRLPPVAEWPTLLLDRPEVRYPERLNCAVELVDAIAAKTPDAPCFRSPSEHLTYRQFADRVDRFARVLVEDLGLVPGGRVLLRAANNPDLMALWFAVAKAGGIVVATMPLLRAGELQKVLERARIGIALCDVRLRDELETAVGRVDHDVRVMTFHGAGEDEELERRAATKDGGFAAVDTAADDVVLIAFTSGTTGNPKGTMHFHRDVLAICDTYSAHIVRPSAREVFIGSPPIAFTFGLGGLVTFPLRVGASSVLLEAAAPDLLRDAIGEFGATTLFTSPTAYRRMLATPSGDAFRTLRTCVSAGETLPLPVFEAWERETGIRILDGIGATEMLHIFISAPVEKVKPGATGLPVPGYEAQVVDDELRPVAPGEIGRLAGRGPTGCRYLDDPRQRDYVRGGWNLTGDTFEVDDEGYFHYRARNDDMIVTSGYNVGGPEVEDALLEHAAVAECAVVGVPDDERGQVIKAGVVLRTGFEGGDAMVRPLQDHVKATIAPYKYPRVVEFVSALPRTETGKVQRYVLRGETR